MPARDDIGDLNQSEDRFNSYLDALARGESRDADDVDPTLAETALRVHAMAAKTNAEIEMMRTVWATVPAGVAAQPPSVIVSSPPLRAWQPRRTRSWRVANHAALAAVLIVALVTGYFGLRDGPPNGGGDQEMGASFADPASAPYAVTGTDCSTDPRTIDEISGLMETKVVEAETGTETTILPDAPDADTIAGVQQTQQQLVACAMEPLRLYALYSDNCLRSQLALLDPREALKPEAVASMVAAQATVAAAKLEEVALLATPGTAPEGAYEVIYPDDIELLSDGRVGALVRTVSVGDQTALLPQKPAYRFFVNVDGRWLYDCDAPESHG
jgi:hypothetical protein